MSTRMALLDKLADETAGTSSITFGAESRAVLDEIKKFLKASEGEHSATVEALDNAARFLFGVDATSDAPEAPAETSEELQTAQPMVAFSRLSVDEQERRAARFLDKQLTPEQARDIATEALRRRGGAGSAREIATEFLRRGR